MVHFEDFVTLKMANNMIILAIKDIVLNARDL